MTRYEYKVIPAPTRGQRGKGVKGADGKFANALEQTMNAMAADGWAYQRAETLPSEERAGLTGKTVTYRNVLVFRRAHAGDPEDLAPQLLDAPDPDLEAAQDMAEAPETDAPETSEDETAEADAADDETTADDSKDDTAEDDEAFETDKPA